MTLGKFKRRGGPGVRPVDPQELFNSLTLRGGVENLWQPQAVALADWHKERARPDVTIEMPTGGGKTLVGLLVAQSIANEASGKVLYVCPNLQLVQQTAAKAREVGLTIATYQKKTWEHKDEFQMGNVPCVTSYAAAFHPFTNLGENLEALIVDDAHVAVGDLKARFSLRINSKHAAFTKLRTILQSCAISVGKGGRFDEALRGAANGVCFLPMFTTAKVATEIQHLLVKSNIDQDTETKYNWGYLTDHLDRCVFLVEKERFEISAPLPAIEAVKAIATSNRRIYLTATLPSPYEAARVFGGRVNAHRISPTGKLGAAQKMLGFLRGDNSDQQRATAAQLVSARKACVIVPSKKDAREKWPDLSVYGKDDGETGLDTFRRAPPPTKIVLAGRFDGIDLPGDSCRILVLDGLPRGTHLIDRFLSESIKSRQLRASSIATKIIQAIGRIFRSNTDHGAVLFVGDDLQRWLMEPYHRGFLPQLLQQQVELGFDFKEGVRNGDFTFAQLLDGVLSASKDWEKIYTENLGAYPPRASSFDEDVSAAFALEHRAARQLWDGNWNEASQRYKEAAAMIEEKEAALGGWFQHLAGLAAFRQGENDAATALFLSAAAHRSEFGRPSWSHTGAPFEGKAGEQAERINVLLAHPQKFFTRLKTAMDRLNYEASSNQLEEAINELGRLLGLEGGRPDNTPVGEKKVTTGPDVIWIAPWRNEGAYFEAKADKLKTSQYTKPEIGQCHDHNQWLLTNHAGTTFSTFIVGRYLGVVPQANPSLDLRVMQPDEFIRIAEALQRVANSALQIPEAQRAATVHGLLKIEGLLWPALLENIESRYVTDLQSNPPAVEDDE